MRFPKVIRHRKIEAKIYGKKANYPFYRVVYYDATHKRRMKHFATYSEAKTEADKLVRDLAEGSHAAGLSASESRDAVAALQRLDSFRHATGRKVSLLLAVSEFCEATGKAGVRSLNECVDGFLATVATLTRKDVSEAVEEFIELDAPRTQAKNGERAQLSSEYARVRAIYLRRFAASFPNTALCDLTKQHLDTFIASLGELSAKYRNHHRAAVRQFLAWAVRKDYLRATHRLGEADQMRPEHANTASVDFYTANELRALLEAAEGPMQAMIAIGGLAGLRTQELLRLEWADVWRVPGHIEVSSSKSKTRQRRLVEMVPALAAWLEPFRSCKTGKLWPTYDNAFQIEFPALCKQAGIARKHNGLRHAFCTYHFALHSNENLTAALAGNSPAMIHSHYKGLATKAEAEKWFALAPKQAENVVPMATAAR